MLSRSIASLLAFSVLLGCSQSSSPSRGKAIDVRQIVEAANSGKMETAMQLAEQALAGDPDNPEALLMFAQVAQARAPQLEASDRAKANALFMKAAEVMRKYATLKRELVDPEKEILVGALFNESRVLATETQPDKAIASLRETMKYGFSNIDLLKNEADFESLRSNPDFRKLVEEATAQAAAAAKQRAAKEMAEQKPFDFSFQLTDLNGKPISSSSLKGKVVIVDFWGTWCPPCRMEIPHFVKLYETHQNAGLEIVGINYEQVAEKDVAATIQAFVKTNNVKYPCVIGDTPTREQVPRFQGFPTTLFIDRHGVVRLKATGYHPYEFLEAVVKTLLEEPANPRT